jgi:transposase
MTDQIQLELFEDDPGLGDAAGRVSVPLAGVARVLLPNRVQRELRACDLESLLPEGHRARLVWAWVERADLGAMYASIRAVAGGSGRTAMAPEILFALWLYATLEGVGSARALARLTQEHDAYRWICGGVSVNYHTLSDFRSAHGETFDAFLSMATRTDPLSATKIDPSGDPVQHQFPIFCFSR